jgi:N-acetyl-gamma-glutamyl-phosphate reductase
VRIVSGEPLPNTAFVRGSNACLMAAVDHRAAGRLVLLSAIDNLVKGASGQAIQNLNRMMGWEEDAGLRAPALFP